MRDKTLVRIWWAWVTVLAIAIIIMVVGVIRNEAGKDRAKLREENAFRARWQAERDARRPYEKRDARDAERMRENGYIGGLAKFPNPPLDK